ADSTSLNVFKTLSAAVALQHADASRRTTILSERGNFPTDVYIAESVAAAAGMKLRLADGNRIAEALSDDVAVGCGYKYLNGGPGAPAFVWAHPRHTARMDREAMRQPLSGWLGHAAPFEFAPSYRPAPGIARFVCGTPPVLAMAALECGLDVFAAAEPLGGIAALRAKSNALVELFIALVEARCAGLGLELVMPRDPANRGSQASFAHVDGWRVMQALIARGVVGDFRAGEARPEGARRDPALDGDLLRFGFTPLYTRFVDAWDAAEQLRDVLASGAFRDERYGRRAKVT